MTAEACEISERSVQNIVAEVNKYENELLHTNTKKPIRVTKEIV